MGTEKFFREVELPEQKSQDNGVLFPAVLSPNSGTEYLTASEVVDFEDAIRAHKPWLESLLVKSGAILFRGFPVTSPSDFNMVIEAFGYPEFPYNGGIGLRTQVLGRVYTANESPLDMEIPFHHEMAYAPDFPTKLFFFCEEEPGAGGETPIVLSHIIYEKMKQRHPDFVDELEKHGLKYMKIAPEDDDISFPSGTSWKSLFKTDDKSIAEESILAAYSDPESEKVGPPKTSAELGNGDPVDDDVLKDVLKILKEECVAIPWKKGDVLVINNLTVLHGRRPLVRAPRRILVSLCK
ncbi:hypothetical protein E3N88_39589 [Mikania micrantha]|uniref:TauD/TfdA-like domain-containing protein n=1 Tax=Mikania micrantha TaxID=192012 RepID=A0A5N6LZV9_9ASTR|nr:hypothetical protein E3N88_39589 [Mikania micrantha]